MQVQEAMAHTIRTVSPKDSIRRVAEVMKEEDTGFMPVVDAGSLVGVITDRDIVLRCIANGAPDLDQEVEQAMTRTVATVEANAELDEAAEIMNRKEIRRLAVTDGGRLVGILSHGNLVQAVHSDGPADTATLGVTRGA